MSILNYNVFIVTYYTFTIEYTQGGILMVGERIKEIRKKNKLTQQEFSSMICVSRPHISGIEHGKYQPSKTIIRLISIVFDVNEEWLLTGKTKG